jgi:hypothetical protein
MCFLLSEKPFCKRTQQSATNRLKLFSEELKDLRGAVLAPQEFTQLLVNGRKGDKSALDAMTPVLYGELRRLAWRAAGGGAPGGAEGRATSHTLQPTALVHEAYIRLVDQHAVDRRNRAVVLGRPAPLGNNSSSRRRFVQIFGQRPTHSGRGSFLQITMNSRLTDGTTVDDIAPERLFTWTGIYTFPVYRYPPSR